MAGIGDLFHGDFCAGRRSAAGSALPSAPPIHLDTPRDGRKYELVDGEILVSPTGMRPEVGLRIGSLIWEFLERNPIGRVYSSDVGIASQAATSLPDVNYVSLAKRPDRRSPDSFEHVIPDLAIEVLSPSDSLRELGMKVGVFLENGVPLVCLVDPARETVTVYRRLTQIEQFSAEQTITAEPLLPRFSVQVRRFV